ncbi:ferroxidase fet3 [Coemansia erecta]|nr:ferroxidase fet3 [Coemansia erecta]
MPLTTLGSSLYKPVFVPTLYTTLSMGHLASNSSIYGPQTNAYILNHLEVIEVIIRNPADGLAIVFVEAPDILQQRQKVPEEMLQMCERQGIPTSGNGAGNQGFDLTGLPPAVYPPS